MTSTPVVDEWEVAARAFETPTRRWSTPGELAAYLNPRTISTPALDAIDAALVELMDTPDGRLIITMAPQEGKSTRVAKDLPTFALTENPDLRLVTASYAQSLANRNGRAIRRNITEHPALGLTIAADHGAVHDWTIGRCPTCKPDDAGELFAGEHRGHEGGVLSVGVGAGLTGRPADGLIIDDPIKDRAQADSPTYRQNVWDWWTDVASTRLAPGGWVVVILTRWHHDDLAGRLLAAEDGHLWKVLNIPAQADHDPNAGETDALGREPGEFMVSARRRTPTQWEAKKVAVGSRTWASLYQGRPTPDTGNLMPRDGWARYTTAPWIVRHDGARFIPEAGRDPDVELIQSWDFTFKDTKSSDYVVGQVWLRRGPVTQLVDMVRARMSFTESCVAMVNMTARWPQAVAKLVEDKANGPAIINALGAKVGGIIPVEPEGSKYARAVAVSPFVEAGNVQLPDPAAVEGTAWVSDLIEEAADFPGGANDDTVDAMSQANHRLLLVPLLNGDTMDAGDILGDEDDDGSLPWAASY